MSESISRTTFSKDKTQATKSLSNNGNQSSQKFPNQNLQNRFSPHSKPKFSKNQNLKHTHPSTQSKNFQNRFSSNTNVENNVKN